MTSTTNILSELRALMADKKYDVQAYIVPSQDAHQSEYVAEKDQRRRYVSGFTGSAGIAVITGKEALLWTDGRYFLQATQEMDNNWTLMKAGLPTTPTQSSWLVKNLPSGSRVGVDPMLISLSAWNAAAVNLQAANIQLVPIDKNLVDEVWREPRVYVNSPIEPLELKFSGMTSGNKVQLVRDIMKNKNAEVLVLTALDEVAYLLNLRGSEITYNPLFFSYIVLTETNLFFFVNPCKINKEVRDHFEKEKLIYELCNYSSIKERLTEIIANSKRFVWISSDSNYSLNSVVPENRRLSENTPVEIMKNTKNEVEAQGMVNAHIKDAAALCCYFAWLTKEVPKGGVTEISGAEKAYEFRKLQKDFMGLSFTTISSSGPSGALIHYNPTPETCRPISTNELYLCDSGGQYRDGTTDVTRTMHFGTPTDEEKDRFTRVLKGQIAVRSAIFPNKTLGIVFDGMARRYLWDIGLNYAHGTGHGIGMFLNVHEGPIGISVRIRPGDPGLSENMFVTNEPGYYEDGKFGIRIEDVVQVVRAENVCGNFSGRGAFMFKTITMVPIQKKMMDLTIMTDKEIEVINDHHKKCLEVMEPVLKAQGQTDAIEWLINETKPITRQGQCAALKR